MKLSGVYSLGSNKVNHDIKDDPVLIVSGQEASTFSKYQNEGTPFLDTLLIKIST